VKKLLHVGCFLLVLTVSAQLKHPKASPFTSITQEVGLTTIKVEYSRPAVRGRKIFGDLVPFGRIWRVGANESTKITFDSDITILNNYLPKGTYALYAFPEQDEWEIVFHKNTTHWGDGRKNYNPEEDAIRVTIVPNALASYRENFLISFDNIDHNSVNLILHWENTEVKVPIKMDTNRLMKIEIQQALSETPTAQTYYEVARYYQEQNTKKRTALKYLEKAIELGGDTYYFYRVKSLVEASLDDYESAIISAQKSMELAAIQDKDEFVRMNEKNITSWKQILADKD